MKKTIVILLISLVTLWLIWQINANILAFAVSTAVSALFLTIWAIGAIIYNIASSIGENINYNLVYIVYAIIIISTIALLVKLNRVMRRKNLLLLCSGVALFCAIFVRVVPDYSNDFGIKVTSIFAYNKYNKGYCLKEDKILSKEERYKRGIIDYFHKKQRLDIMLGRYYCKHYNWIHSCRITVDNIGYYKSDNVNNDNIIDILPAHVGQVDSNGTYFKYEKTEPKKKDIYIDGIKAGFKTPIFYDDGVDLDWVYYGYSFILGKDFTFSAHSELNQHISKEEYEKKFQREYEYKERYYKIDNCGNTDKNVLKTFHMLKDRLDDGG